MQAISNRESNMQAISNRKSTYKDMRIEYDQGKNMQLKEVREILKNMKRDKKYQSYLDSQYDQSDLIRNLW